MRICKENTGVCLTLQQLKMFTAGKRPDPFPASSKYVQKFRDKFLFKFHLDNSYYHLNLSVFTGLENNSKFSLALHEIHGTFDGRTVYRRHVSDFMTGSALGLFNDPGEVGSFPFGLSSKTNAATKLNNRLDTMTKSRLKVGKPHHRMEQLEEQTRPDSYRVRFVKTTGEIG